MEKYIEILKKCRTLKGVASVYVAVLLDEKLTNKEKNTFQAIYIEYCDSLGL